MNFFEIHISIAFLVLFIILVRKRLFLKLPVWTIAALWMIVILRLTTPFHMRSHLSILNPWNRLGLMVQDFVARYAETNFHIYMQSLSNHHLFDSSLHFIWIAGVIFFSVFYIFSFFNVCTKINSAEIVHMAYLEKELKAQKLRRKVVLKVSDEFHSPASCGLLRPVIVFPRDFDFEDKNLCKMVILHECSHIRQFHFVFQVLAIIGVCIFWYNPIFWLIKRYVERDCELICDYFVAQKLGSELREDYATSLITMASNNSANLVLCNSYHMKPIKERIELIMKKRKKNSLVALITSCFILFGAWNVFATGPTFITNTDDLDIIIIEEFFEPTVEGVSLYLDVASIAPYIVQVEAEASSDSEIQRAPSSLKIQNYKYSTHGSLPSPLHVSIKNGAYTYSGNLYLDVYDPRDSNGLITGYYSGTLYR